MGFPIGSESHQFFLSLMRPPTNTHAGGSTRSFGSAMSLFATALQPEGLVDRVTHMTTAHWGGRRQFPGPLPRRGVSLDCPW